MRIRRSSGVRARDRRTFALPFSREPLELMQHLLDILHAVGDAVGDGGRDGRLVVAENKPCLFQGAQPFGENAGGNAFDLPPQNAKAQRAVIAERPQDVQGPGPREQFQHPADGAGRRGVSRFSRSHVDTKLL